MTSRAGIGLPGLLRQLQVVLLSPFLFFVKPRLPRSGAHLMPMRTLMAGFGFAKTRTFWVLQIGTLIQGLGYFIPQLYLPSITPVRAFILSSLTFLSKRMLGCTSPSQDHSWCP